MKKITIFLVMVLVLVSCKDMYRTNGQKKTQTEWKNLTDNRSEYVIQFDSIGEEHNKILSEVYGTLYEAKTAKGRSIHAKLTNNEIESIINQYLELGNENSLYNSSNNPLSTDDEHIIGQNEEFKFSDQANVLIEQIKLLIDPITTSSPQSEVQDVIMQIEAIENSAESVILNEEKEPFYAYTSTSKASLAYWYDNLESWDALCENGESNGRAVGFFKRLALTIASDAAGVATGAVIGAGIGSAIPGVGTAAGAIIGGIVVGADSSSKAWSSKSFSIVISFDKLQKKIAKGL